MNPPARPEIHPLDELIEILQISFTFDELREFVRGLPRGTALLEELPAGPSTRSALFGALVHALARAGRFEPALFVRLAGERPRHAAKIRAIGSALCAFYATTRSEPEATPRSGDDVQQLHELLARLFEVDELRRWLRSGPEGEALLRALPGGPISADELAFQASELLARRGLVGAALFARLREGFPRHAAAIERVRGLWPSEP